MITFAEYLAGVLAWLAVLGLLFDLALFAVCLRLAARTLADARDRIERAEAEAAYWRRRYANEIWSVYP